MNSAGPRIERSTCVSAAKLTIASQPAADSATASGSQMSPWKNSCAMPSRFARLPEYVSLSSTTTLSPRSARRRTKCEPMKPAPPVTSTRIRRSLARHLAEQRCAEHAREPGAAVLHHGVVVPRENRPSDRRHRVHPALRRPDRPLVRHGRSVGSGEEAEGAGPVEAALRTGFDQVRPLDTRDRDVELDRVRDLRPPDVPVHRSLAVPLTVVELRDLLDPLPPFRPALGRE